MLLKHWVSRVSCRPFPSCQNLLPKLMFSTSWVVTRTIVWDAVNTHHGCHQQPRWMCCCNPNGAAWTSFQEALVPSEGRDKLVSTFLKDPAIQLPKPTNVSSGMIIHDASWLPIEAVVRSLHQGSIISQMLSYSDTWNTRTGQHFFAMNEQFWRHPSY